MSKKLLMIIAIRGALITLLGLLSTDMVAQGFSADFIEHGDGSSRGKLYGQSDRLRLENYDAESGAVVSAVLVDFTRHTTIVVLPSQRTYLDLSEGSFAHPLDWQMFRPDSADDACSSWQKVATAHKKQQTCKKLGVEMIDGRSAVKYQASGFDSSDTGFLWVDQRLRLILKAEGKGTHIEMRNVKDGSQPPSLFETPTGFQKMDPRGTAGNPANR
jgi:hypothetical protein